MTDEERAVLSRPELKLFGPSTGIVSAICVFVLTFLIVSLPTGYLSFAIALRASAAAAVVASVAWYVWVQRRERHKHRKHTDLVAREREADFVKSTVYSVKDAVAVEEFEDEGLSYYLLLDDGRTLFLSGQYLYDPAEQGFPWESFEVVRVPHEGWVLRVVPIGPRLTPVWTRGPFTDVDFDSDAVPEDGTIATRDFGALKTGSRQT